MESAEHPLQADAHDRALTRGRPGRRRALWSALIAAVVVAALYIGLPRIAGLDETWGRLSEGDPWWLGVAVLLEAASYGGYVLLFRGVFVGPGSPIGWRESYQITMSGVAATRLLAAGAPVASRSPAGRSPARGWAVAPWSAA